MTARDIPELFGDVHVTGHALDRLREHHPNAGVRGALRMLGEALPIAGGEVAGFLQRPLHLARDEYFLAFDDRGIFVLAPRMRESDRARSMVTYIRLSLSQQERAREIWRQEHLEAPSGFEFAAGL